MPGKFPNLPPSPLSWNLVRIITQDRIMAGSEIKADLWINEYISPWLIYSQGIKQVYLYKKTAFQEMAIVETGKYGKGLFLDGKFQSSVADEFLYHEPLVHPAMLCHGNPRQVLILGGGEGATLREVLRWQSVERAQMVDIDGEVVDACKEHLSEMHQGAFDDPRTELTIADAKDVLDTTSTQWDVIISDLSDPVDSGPAFELFTQEFFDRLRRVLAPEGYLVVQASDVAPPDFRLHTRLAKTLSQIFPHVVSYTNHIPCFGLPWSFLLASNREIDRRPDPDAIDSLLASQTTGNLGYLDGITYLGLLQTPAHIRRAIAAETEIFTLANPPKFFGKGIASSNPS